MKKDLSFKSLIKGNIGFSFRDTLSTLELILNGEWLEIKKHPHLRYSGLHIFGKMEKVVNPIRLIGVVNLW